MARHILFLTGSLAEDRLRQVLHSLAPLPFEATIVNLGVKVAALATTEIVLRGLDSTHGADLILLPGRFCGDLDVLAAHFGTAVERDRGGDPGQPAAHAAHGQDRAGGQLSVDRHRQDRRPA